MSRTPGKDVRAVAIAIADTTFLPTPTMMKVKAQFYANWHGMKEPRSVDVIELTGSGTVKDWWPKPGFRDWFLNKDTTQAQLKYLKDLALNKAEEILNDPDANTSAKVSLIKNILIYNEAIEQKSFENSNLKLERMSTPKLREALLEAKLVLEAEKGDEHE